MRIATRRIRAALRVFRDVLLEESSKAFRSEFHWLASALADENRKTLFALGRLAQRQQAITQRCRATLNRVLHSFRSKAKPLS